MSTSDGHVLLTDTHISLLALDRIKVGFAQDLPGTMLAFDACRGVADVIMSLSNKHVQLLAQQTQHQPVIKLVNGNNPIWWADIARALANVDHTAIRLSMVQSLMMGGSTAISA
jgi:hypothetical protein